MRSLLRWLPSDTFGAVNAVSSSGSSPDGRRRRPSGTLEIAMDTSWQMVARAIGDGSLTAALASEAEEGVEARSVPPQAALERRATDIPLGHRGDAEPGEQSSRSSPGASHGASRGSSHGSSHGGTEPGSPGAPSRSTSPFKQKKRRGAGGGRGGGANSGAAYAGAHDDVGGSIEDDAFAA